MKIKTNFYLRNKFLARGKKAELAWTNPKQATQFFDEEFYTVIEWLPKQLSLEQWRNLTEQDRLEITRNFFNENCSTKNLS